MSVGRGSVRYVVLCPLPFPQGGQLFLSFVDSSLVRRHFDALDMDSAAVMGLLETRAIPAGTPVFLDDVTMLPIEPLCSWCRHLAYDDKDAKTMREYAYILRRFVHFLQSRRRTRRQRPSTTETSPTEPN
jgi:hypothetical protein